MGLRFRKSIKICDGLKLNFGKTGMSMTVGSGPLKKTFNTNGNVTTTVGIPGTGIYWTETERRGSKNNRRTQNAHQTRSSLFSPQNDYQVAPAVNDYFTQGDSVEEVDAMPASTPRDVAPPRSDISHTTVRSPATPAAANGLSAEAIRRIYLYEDAPIDWTELIAGASADDLLMDHTVHAYCMQMAPRILSGDVDAYLEVIEQLRPVDDLALYSGDFEFGTDNANYIEVEFSVKLDRVLENVISDDLLEEFISAITVRVTRDLFALLPVVKVLVHVENNGNTALSVVFTRDQLSGLSFRNHSASWIVKQFRHQAAESFIMPKHIEKIRI